MVSSQNWSVNSHTHWRTSRRQIRTEEQLLVACHPPSRWGWTVWDSAVNQWKPGLNQNTGGKTKRGVCLIVPGRSAYLVLHGSSDLWRSGREQVTRVCMLKNMDLLTGNALLMLLKLLFRWMKVPTGRRPRTVWLRPFRTDPLANTV